jgi:hypothetical protein
VGAGHVRMLAAGEGRAQSVGGDGRRDWDGMRLGGGHKLAVGGTALRLAWPLPCLRLRHERAR